MAVKRKIYTPEFKLAAVKMITHKKLSIAEVARRLGVTESRLHEWEKALATRASTPSPAPAISPHSKTRTAACGPRTAE